MQAGEITVPFGKYKGISVFELMADRDYCAWAKAQPGMRERYPAVFVFIDTGGEKLEDESPEHNLMQNLFLDPENVARVYRAVFGDERIANQIRDRVPDRRAVREAWKAAEAEELKRLGFAPAADVWETPSEKRWAAKAAADEIGKAAAQEAASAILKSERLVEKYYSILRNTKATFEVNNWDVVIEKQSHYEPVEVAILCVELKPVLGDDYPKVLRRLGDRVKWERSSGLVGSERRYRALIVDKFNAAGTTFQQLKEIFHRSGIAVRSLNEVLAAFP